jgi:hypothetical protein
MKRIRNSLFVGTVFASLVMALVASPVPAYPPDPDNAALLYYQGILTLVELNEEARDRIRDVARGEVTPDDKVREDISKCKGAIQFAEAAAQVPACNWGVRYSQGFDALMPQMAHMKVLTFVLVADARIRASDGDYRGALERCLMTCIFAHHVGDDTLVSYLVSLSVRAMVYKCMQDIIGQAVNDEELLRWFKNEFVTSPADTLSPARPLKIELEIVTDLMQMDNIEKLARILADSDEKKMADIIKKADKKILEQARRIYSERIKSALTIFSTPMRYEQAHSQLKQSAKNFDPNDPASASAGAFIPALARILTLKTRTETHANALKAAIDICLTRAKTGRLPDTLPTGLPNDLFSGKDFEYEKTKDAFILRCRGKDLDKDEIYEYEFKVKK